MGIFKKIALFSACLVLVFSLGQSVKAAQIAYVDCENRIIDSLVYFTSTTGNPSYATGGVSGSACRSAHNDDDGDSDDFRELSYSGFPASGVFYTSFYLKYEPQYVNTSSNVKWVWIQGNTSGHLELIYSVDSTPGRLDLRMQLGTGGAGFDSGTDGSKYFNVNYTKGNWMHVEFYIRKSSGTGNLNPDGIVRLTINGSVVFEDLHTVTGAMNGLIHLPGINGTADQASGHGWWQLDELRVHDSLPNSTTCTN